MIITILKYLVFSVSWFFIFKQLKKNNYRGLFNNLNVQLLTLPQADIYRFFSDLISNRNNENSILSRIAIPLGLDWRTLCDTNSKKFFLLGLVLAISTYRWFILFKKVFLWPFKLGIFSFFYSILGFDVKWFLGFFDFFSINVPSWIYVQYLTLYNNWINWWYNTVNIKNLNTVPLPETKLNKINKNIKKSWKLFYFRI